MADTRNLSKLTTAMANVIDEQLKRTYQNGHWIREAVWEEFKSICPYGDRKIYVLVISTSFPDLWLRVPFVFDAEADIDLTNRREVEELSCTLWSLAQACGSLKSKSRRLVDIDENLPV
jgi:hypothetical protein